MSPLSLITVQPRPEQRRAFARWAVAQVPQVRTVSQSAFGVPPHLYTDMPEALLRGALVDGHPYRSPADYEATEPAPADAPTLLGVATPDGLRDAVPVPPLPEAPRTFEEGELVVLAGGGEGQETYVPLGDADGDADGDTVGDAGGDGGGTPAALPSPAAAPSALTSGDTPGDRGDKRRGERGDKAPAARPFTCPDCPRTFTTERGRTRHRRSTHGR
ncbi:C2H2-type zinc finger protein [Streptomyces albidoflavus]|nr:C2H2-type zinc finger protein [Streptomyces albidoflavus]